MSWVFEDRSDDRHDRPECGRPGRFLSRLSSRPSAAPPRGVWWPAAQLQKKVRPRCIPPVVAHRGAGPAPTPNLIKEGADVHQRTRSPWGRPTMTGHSGVTITPPMRPTPVQTLAEPSHR